MRVINRTQDRVVADRVQEARTFLARLRGGLGARPFESGQGLYLAPCAWVHALGLGWPLDAVYVDRRGVVLAVRTLRPGRIGPWMTAARGVLELRAGACAGGACRPGDQLDQDGGCGW